MKPLPSIKGQFSQVWYIMPGVPGDKDKRKHCRSHGKFPDSLITKLEDSVSEANK